MADFRIQREHALGLPKARKVAWQWAEDVEKNFDMQCTVIEGDDEDTVEFSRAGVNGTLTVTADRFDLHARLGLLLGGRWLQRVAFVVMPLGLALSVLIALAWLDAPGSLVYLLGAWSPPLGIALRADGLSVAMQLAVAGAHAGVNSNLLADETLFDPISGNAVLNGIPVTVAPA